MRRQFNVISFAVVAALAATGAGVGLAVAHAATSHQASAGRLVHAPHEMPHGADSGAVNGPARIDASECGSSCFLLYSRRLGLVATMNAVIPSDDGSGGRIGRKLNLRNAAGRMPDGDFSMSFVAEVWQFCGTDVHDFWGPASYICTHDSNYPVFEAEWAPYGQSSGYCAGVAVANQPGETITLRQCGLTSKTLWIASEANGSGGKCRGTDSYCPWMNGSDSNFRAPDVLTLDSSTYAPGDQLKIAPENLLPAGNQGRAWNNQEFAFFWQARS